MKNKILTGVLLVIMLVTASGWVMSANENETLTEVAQEQKDDINKKSTEIANLKDVIVEKDADLESNKVVINEKNTQIDKLKKKKESLEKQTKDRQKIINEKSELNNKLISNNKSLSKQLNAEKAKKKVVKATPKQSKKTPEKTVKKSTQVTKETKAPETKKEKSVSTASVKKEEKNPEVPKSNGRTINVSATSYVAMCDTGCTGITATGIDVRNSITYNGYRIIAVDPSVIPLGSIVSVSVGGQTFTAMALDTGGAIKGNKIDILVGSHSQAISAGRQQATVTIMK